MALLTALFLHPMVAVAQPPATDLADPSADPSPPADPPPATSEPRHPAEATPAPPGFREAVLTAIDEYDRGLYEEALASFERALAMRRSARVLRGIGKTLFELRRYARSLAFLEEALASDVDPLGDALRAEVESLAARARAYVGTLTVVVSPPDAELWIDGRRHPASTPTRLSLGEHTVRVAAEGHHTEERILRIESGAAETLEVHLSPIAPAVTRVEVPVPLPNPAPARDDGPWLVPGLVALGAGAAGAVASVVWFVDRDAATAECVRAAAAGAECENASSIAAQRDASMWTIGISVAAITAGAVVLAVGAAGGDAPSASAACVPDARGVRCEVIGWF